MLGEHQQLQKPMCSMPKDFQEKSWLAKLTRQDEEYPRDKGEDGPVRPNVADVAQDEADKHEEEADQREGGGRADHLWGERSRGKREQVSPPHTAQEMGSGGWDGCSPAALWAPHVPPRSRLMWVILAGVPLFADELSKEETLAVKMSANVCISEGFHERCYTGKNTIGTCIFL